MNLKGQNEVNIPHECKYLHANRFKLVGVCRDRIFISSHENKFKSKTLLLDWEGLPLTDRSKVESVKFWNPYLYIQYKVNKNDAELFDMNAEDCGILINLYKS